MPVAAELQDVAATRRGPGRGLRARIERRHPAGVRQETELRVAIEALRITKEHRVPAAALVRTRQARRPRADVGALRLELFAQGLQDIRHGGFLLGRPAVIGVLARAPTWPKGQCPWQESPSSMSLPRLTRRHPSAPKSPS